MTLSPLDLLFYALTLAVLVLTPGPVWVAMAARALTGGYSAAWPLAVGVAVGDAIWPLLAIFGVVWVTSVFAGFMIVLKWAAVVIFIAMGWALLRAQGGPIGQDSRLTRPGLWAGFFAGVAVILSNPKAILFYMGVLPGFFDLTQVTALDIAAIVTLSMMVPLLGNLVLAVGFDRVRRLLASPKALRRVNRISGVLLLCVGLLIALSS